MEKIIIFLLVSSFGFAQNLHVNYDATFNLSGILKQPIQQKVELIINQKQSLSKKYIIDRKATKENMQEGRRLMTVGSDTLLYYKDYTTSKLYSEEKIFNKVFNVEDDLELFDWQITNDTLSVLGYSCFKATTKFRGREFEAYFAKDIPISDGPMKFNGLPGLILKIKLINSEGTFTAEATKISNINSTSTLTNPYSKFTDFENFKENYIQKMNELTSYNTGKSGQIFASGFEILIVDE